MTVPLQGIDPRFESGRAHFYPFLSEDKSLNKHFLIKYAIMEYASGLFIIVNSLISIYIVIYAYVFLTRTKSYPDRRPWDLLFASALFFLLSQLISVFILFNNKSIFGLDIMTIKMIMEFLYATMVLMAFITQSHLILRSDLILITKKVEIRKDEEKEKKNKKTKTSNEQAFEKLGKRMLSDAEIHLESASKIAEEMKKEGFVPELMSEKEIKRKR
jgi:hypothetical protein